MYMNSSRGNMYMNFKREMCIWILLGDCVSEFCWGGFLFKRGNSHQGDDPTWILKGDYVYGFLEGNMYMNSWRGEYVYEFSGPITIER